MGNTGLLFTKAMSFWATKEPMDTAKRMDTFPFLLFWPFYKGHLILLAIPSLPSYLVYIFLFLKLLAHLNSSFNSNCNFSSVLADLSPYYHVCYSLEFFLHCILPHLLAYFWDHWSEKLSIFQPLPSFQTFMTFILNISAEKFYSISYLNVPSIPWTSSTSEACYKVLGDNKSDKVLAQLTIQ